MWCSTRAHRPKAAGRIEIAKSCSFYSQPCIYREAHACNAAVLAFAPRCGYSSTTGTTSLFLSARRVCKYAHYNCTAKSNNGMANARRIFCLFVRMCVCGWVFACRREPTQTRKPISHLSSLDLWGIILRANHTHTPIKGHVSEGERKSARELEREKPKRLHLYRQHIVSLWILVLLYFLFVSTTKN